ncbi:hypothetical protein BS47DRAFT_1372591 [Hydnum rufescens UP504]|uniref:RRM domain-containing protein n=1 Tax=Hydnum rufescens UP504 TaxID=1448309 RepID=A0A9P6DVZ0_9AGAM|nr:hypothetical protein BS47DRAFT_1372591 [Hydnum rufescens UP504]
MATALDKSLDDIISSRPRGRRGARRSARGPAAATAAEAPVTSARARYAGAVPAANGNRVVSAPAATPVVQADATKIIVSNLPFDVNEHQIKELFSSTVGPLREVNLHYDHKGVSKGVAAVTFNRKGDGNKAFTQYNNRLIDGKRPMKIEIVVDPARPAAISLSQRVAPASVTTVVAATNGTGSTQSSARGRNTGGGKTGRGRGGGRRKGNERPAKTAADLDAEMEDYTAAPAPAV